jgi:hypothetical protein
MPFDMGTLAEFSIRNLMVTGWPPAGAARGRAR